MKLVYIDSLRGIAILMVILVHVSLCVHHLPYSINLLSKYGQMGVQLFFIISALTLFLSLSYDKNYNSNKGDFFIKRFFRIAPMYYFGILFYFSLQTVKYSIQLETVTFPPNYTTLNIISNMIFVHGFYPSANNNIVPGGWSIGTEMAFYLLIPSLFYIFQKLKIKYGFKILFITLVTIIFSIYGVELYMLSQDFTIKNNSFLYFNLLNQLPVFLIGIILFYWQGKSYFFKNKSLFLFLLFTALALYLLSINIKISYIFMPLLSSLSFLFLFTLFKENHYLNRKLLRRIGELSFSIYIIHFLFAIEVSHQLEKLLNPILNPIMMLLFLFLVTTTCSYFLALLTEKFIEKPGIALGKKIIKLRKKVKNVS